MNFLIEGFCLFIFTLPHVSFLELLGEKGLTCDDTVFTASVCVFCYIIKGAITSIRSSFQVTHGQLGKSFDKMDICKHHAMHSAALFSQ